jgi:transcriptional regulator with XRE-family HTH domain
MLASRLRQLRHDREWTQGEVANAAGIDRRHYQKIEAAQINVTLETLAALAIVFRVQVRDLL